MADALRELTALIDFDMDLGGLLKMDDLIDDAEDEVTKLGKNIDVTADAARDLGRVGSRGMDDLAESSKGAETQIDGLGKTTKSIDDIGDSSIGASKKVSGLGESGGGVGERIKGGMGRAMEGIKGLIPASGLAEGAMGALSIAGVAAGTAIIGIFVAASGYVLKLADDLDTTNDRMAATIGATTKETDDMRKAALDVYKNGWGESYQSITGDIALLKGQFRDMNEKELSDTAQKMSVISDLWGPESKEIINATSVMTKTFDGLSKSDALDLITTGYQKGGPAAEDLLETISEYSVFFEKSGQSAQGFIGSMVRAMQAGSRNTDVAADAFKEFGIITTDVGSQAAVAFKDLGFDSKKMMKDMAGGGPKAKRAFDATTAALSTVTDPLKQNTLGVQLFGTKWEDLRDTIILSMNHGEEAVAGFQGATKRAGDQLTGNFTSQISQAGRMIKGEFMEAVMDSGLSDYMSNVGKGIVAAIPGIIEGVTTIIDWVVSAFKGGEMTAGSTMANIVGTVQNAITLIMLIWQAVGPFLINTFKGAFSTVTAIISGAFQLINDLLSVFVAVFKGDWSGAWAAIGNLLNNAVDNILNIARNGLQLMFTIFDSTIYNIYEAITGVDLTQAGRDIIDGLINGIKSMKDKAVNAVKEMGQSIKDNVTGFFKIHSPSRVMADIGKFLPIGLQVGISGAASKAVKAAKDMTARVGSAASYLTDKIAPKIQKDVSADVAITPNVVLSPTKNDAVDSVKPMKDGVIKPDAPSVIVKDATDQAKDAPEIAPYIKEPKEPEQKAVPQTPVSTPSQPQDNGDRRPTISIGSISIPVTVERGADGSAPSESMIQKAMYAAIEKYFGNLIPILE